MQGKDGHKPQYHCVKACFLLSCHKLELTLEVAGRVLLRPAVRGRGWSSIIIGSLSLISSFDENSL